MSSHIARIFLALFTTGSIACLSIVMILLSHGYVPVVTVSHEAESLALLQAIMHSARHLCMLLAFIFAVKSAHLAYLSAPGVSRVFGKSAVALVIAFLLPLIYQGYADNFHGSVIAYSGHAKLQAQAPHSVLQ